MKTNKIKGWKLSAFLNHILGISKKRVLTRTEWECKANIIDLIYNNKKYRKFDSDQLFRILMKVYSFLEASNKGGGFRTDKKQKMTIYIGPEPEINLFDQQLAEIIRQKLEKELEKISQTYEKIPPEMPIWLKLGGIIWKEKNKT